MEPQQPGQNMWRHHLCKTSTMRSKLNTLPHLPAMLTIAALAMAPTLASAQQATEPTENSTGDATLSSKLQEVQEHSRRRARHNEVGMLVLMSWAGLNIASGLAGWGLADSRQWKSFHQMNAMWNVVNLGIGYFGYRGARRDREEGVTSLAESLDAGFNMERLLAFNAGLDVGYIMLGAYMWERGRRLDDARWKGFGQSVMVQGAFLMGFDLFLLFKNKGIDDELLSLQMTLGRSLHGAWMPGVSMTF